MILLELILTSFGKFNNKTIKLDKGINIVYGDNEAGKSTIHKFIEGMFFGFYKPYTKRRMYSDDYDKYFPWDQSDFRGTLKYLHEQNIYRIERNFAKGSDEVKIFDDKNGEDITQLFDYDNTTRLYQPSSLHLCLNRVVYNNTISISQLKNKTEELLAKEVKDSLINLGGSMDEDISIKKVLEKLDKQINDIGTKNRVKTSPYGKIIDELEKLKEEEKNAKKIYKQIKENQIELNNLGVEIENLEIKKDNIRKNLLLIESYRAYKRYEEVIKIQDEIHKLEENVDTLKGYQNISEEDYTEIIRTEEAKDYQKGALQNNQVKSKKLLKELKKIEDYLDKFKNYDSINREDIDNLVSKYHILNEKKDELNEITLKIQQISSKINDKDSSIADILDDLYLYEEKEEERNKLIYNSEYGNLEFIKTRLEEKEKALKKHKVFQVTSVIGGAIATIIGFAINYLFLLICLLPVGFLLYSLISSKELKNYIIKLKNQLEEKTAEIQKRNDKIKSLESEMEYILKKYNCSSKLELKKFADEYSKESILYKDKLSSLNEITSKRDMIISEIDNYEKSIKNCIKVFGFTEINLENIKNAKSKYEDYIRKFDEKQRLDIQLEEINNEIKKSSTKVREYEILINNIYEKNNIENIEEFKYSLEKKKELEKIIQSIESKRGVLSKLLEDKSIEGLKEKSKKYRECMNSSIKILDQEKLEKELKSIESEIYEKRNQYTRLEERISNLLNSITPLVQIEEEILRKTKQKEEYEENLRALELSRNTIDKISKDIQRDFAPKLNKKVGSIIKGITGSRYTEVKITEKLDIKVTDPKTHKLVDIERLSGGTIDQIYFATRFGIIDTIMKGANTPLILDDCFIQYDNKRLANILEFLAKEANNRQIILFTCHEREKEIFEDMGISFNFIQL